MMVILLFWERLYLPHALFSCQLVSDFFSNTDATAPLSRFPRKTAVLLAFPEVREKITRIMREFHAVRSARGLWEFLQLNAPSPPLMGSRPGLRHAAVGNRTT